MADTSIYRRNGRIANRWAELWFKTVLATILMVLVILVLSCGKNPANYPTSTTCPVTACGDGLAAVDLSGACRANPPSPGALEASCNGHTLTLTVGTIDTDRPVPVSIAGLPVLR